MPDVVTRFAPSPTGYLHVGGARTALFNRLYADRHGGRMLLRIEDTDRDRSTAAATDAILDGLTWLGIRWDGEPVFQSTRADRHRAAVDGLLASGLAYRCYATPDELLAMRDLATAEKRSPRYDGRWRDRDPSDAPAGAPFAVRLKAPRDGDTAIDDGVQGRVSWRNADLDDLVLLRQDGTPTYMLAVVVDDHDMGVTQIIRGDDHLTNSARQALIYRALGWEVPAMAHIPLIHSMQGRKLSKRDGAVAVGDYRDQGILPRAMRNHLLRLGWGHGDREVISDAEASALFGLDGVGKSPSRFDPKRLLSLNGHYIRDSADGDLLDAMAGSRDDDGNPLLPPLDGALRDRVLVALPALAKRANSAAEMADGAGFLVSPPDLGDAADPKVRDVLDAPGARDRLRDLRAVLDGVGDWTEPTLAAATEAHLASAGLRMGDVAQPLRAALTGRLRSIGVFEILAALGRDGSLSRLDAAAPAPSMEP